MPQRRRSLPSLPLGVPGRRAASSALAAAGSVRTATHRALAHALLAVRAARRDAAWARTRRLLSYSLLILLVLGGLRGRGGGDDGLGGRAAHLSAKLGRRGALGGGADPGGSPMSADIAHIAALRRTFEHQRLASIEGILDTWIRAPGLAAAAAATLQGAGSPRARAHLAAVRTATTAAVRAAIHAAQHPANCSTARLMVGSINKACGFGCEVHHAAHLLALALASNRTLVLSMDQWRYDGGEGGSKGAGPSGADSPPPLAPGASPAWESAFLPISHCALPDGWQHAPLYDHKRPDAHDGERVVRGTIIDVGPAPADPQGAMPPDVFDLVASFTARPEVWWVGALADFLLRPSAAATARRAAFNAAHGLLPSWGGGGGQEGGGGGASSSPRPPPAPPRPYISVHVRRTDKVEGDSAEAAAHELGEYLGAAEAVAAVWAQSGGGGGGGSDDSHHSARPTQAAHPPRATTPATPPPPRLLVYLATDDAAVLASARSTHPGIDFVADEAAASSAAMASRNSASSLAGVADDVERLAGGAWLVGTFSSQISRLAHELAMVRGFPGVPGVDVAFRATSVDSAWYYGGGADIPFCTDVALLPSTDAKPTPRDPRPPSGVEPGGRLACSPLAAHPAGPGILHCRRRPTPSDGRDTPVDAPAALIRRCAEPVEEGGGFGRLLAPDVAEAAGRGVLV